MPWDQIAFWAVTICIGMMEYIPGVGPWLETLNPGGPALGPVTLTTFYAIHTTILPALLIILMPFHFWRVRKAGGLVIPHAHGENAERTGDRVDTIPNLILREVVVALVLLAFILVFSMLFDAPLESKANPGLSPNPTKAPWYFAGLQEMLMHFHPIFSLFVIPVLVTIALLGVPYINYQSSEAGVWFTSLKGRRMAIMAALTAVILTPIGILADDVLIDFTAWMGVVPASISNGLIPLVIILAIGTGFYLVLKGRFSATNNEAIQAIFVLFLVAFLILTVTGIWFRGEGMRLMWPFFSH